MSLLTRIYNLKSKYRTQQGLISGEKAGYAELLKSRQKAVKEQKSYEEGEYAQKESAYEKAKSSYEASQEEYAPGLATGSSAEDVAGAFRSRLKESWKEDLRSGKDWAAAYATKVLPYKEGGEMYTGSMAGTDLEDRISGQFHYLEEESYQEWEHTPGYWDTRTESQWQQGNYVHGTFITEKDWMGEDRQTYVPGYWENQGYQDVEVRNWIDSKSEYVTKYRDVEKFDVGGYEQAKSSIAEFKSRYEDPMERIGSSIEGLKVYGEKAEASGEAATAAMGEYAASGETLKSYYDIVSGYTGKLEESKERMRGYGASMSGIQRSLLSSQTLLGLSTEERKRGVRGRRTALYFQTP